MSVLVLVCMILLAVSLTSLIMYRHKQAQLKASEARKLYVDQQRPDLDVELLTVNEYSRPGIALKQVNGIVVHYTANPGTSAIENRNYFEGLKDSHVTKASSHFIIGLEGEIVQCIPCNEISYASNDRNDDTISIECCIEDETGKFNDATYDALIHLTAWLCQRYGTHAAGAGSFPPYSGI